MLFTQLMDNGQVAMGDASLLQTICVNLRGEHIIDCIIDNGSCIVAAQWKVSECLGVPAQSDMVMSHEDGVITWDDRGDYQSGPKLSHVHWNIGLLPPAPDL
jgi:hypothetical protein